jgi:hypothetical protein
MISSLSIWIWAKGPLTCILNRYSFSSILGSTGTLINKKGSSDFNILTLAWACSSLSYKDYSQRNPAFSAGVGLFQGSLIISYISIEIKIPRGCSILRNLRRSFFCFRASIPLVSNSRRNLPSARLTFDLALLKVLSATFFSGFSFFPAYLWVAT